MQQVAVGMEVSLEGERLHGKAFNPLDDTWSPFDVDIDTGEVTGGSYCGDMQPTTDAGGGRVKAQVAAPRERYPVTGVTLPTPARSPMRTVRIHDFGETAEVHNLEDAPAPRQ